MSFTKTRPQSLQGSHGLGNPWLEQFGTNIRAHPLLHRDGTGCLIYPVLQAVLPCHLASAELLPSTPRWAEVSTLIS